LFTAGNGNESVDNDGYASYAEVIAVAACNRTGRRSAYSDFGNCGVLSRAPMSSGPRLANPNRSLPAFGRGPVWDRRLNTGTNADGDIEGMFTDRFGSTSSACPGAVDDLFVAVGTQAQRHPHGPRQRQAPLLRSTTPSRTKTREISSSGRWWERGARGIAGHGAYGSPG